MSYANEDQRFKDAIGEYIHKRIAQLNKFGDGLREIDPGFCARHDDAEIFEVFRDCMTQDDRDEIKTHCCEWRTVSEVNHETVKYYDQLRDDEMERQILILMDERQRNGHMCA